jgi:2-succinyl-5-enolpyruvyl-6-hydroxy-3-cyclohexene-1-carboxylate synthase
MASTTDTYLLLGAFADELARCGMRAACTSPGSRSAPLVLSLARDERLRCYSHVDERCAGFFALGLAKASGLPVAVACTSGTAAAELLPAVIEAHEARVPLLILTADRPAELRENGAGQAVDQLKLYGDASKWFFEVAVHEAGPDQLRWMRTLACRAYWTALEGRAGAVHLNFPLREPLVTEESLPEDSSGRAGGAPYLCRPPAPPTGGTPRELLGELLSRSRRGVVVAGRHERPTPLGRAAAEFAERAGWPLLADPLSGARRGEAAVAHYDALLRTPGLAERLQPDLVLRVGDLPVSKPLRDWLAGLSGVVQVALDPEGAWQDPSSTLWHSLALDPAETLSELADARPGRPGAPAAAEQDWLSAWRSADERAAEAIIGVLGDAGLCEPVAAAELGVLLPEEAMLFVASSMPVRDIETFWPVRSDPPRVLCNRGANGIDGTVSSAFGAAAHEGSAAGGAASGAGPVVLLVGDVALAHDIGGLLAWRRLGLKLTIVLLDNGGGGIFDFLPVSGASMARASERAHAVAASGLDDEARAGSEATGAESDATSADIYTRHIATPTGLDFSAAAALYGLAHERAGDVPTFRAALERALASERSTIVEVRGERAANVELHRHVWRAVSGALSR